jgi:hypothetical protein
MRGRRMRLCSIDGERTIGIGCYRSAHRQQLWAASGQIWPSVGASILIREQFRESVLQSSSGSSSGLGRGEDSERVGAVENGRDLAKFCRGRGHWRRGALVVGRPGVLYMKPSWCPFPKMKEKEKQERRGVKAQFNSFFAAVPSL